MGAPFWGAIGKFFAKNVIGKMIASYALSVVTQKLFGPKAKRGSPTYDGMLQTQIDSSMPMPLIYGRVKTAGNQIWAKQDGKKIMKIISFGLGPVQAIRDLRINDLRVSGVAAFNVHYTGADKQAEYAFKDNIFYLNTFREEYSGGEDSSYYWVLHSSLTLDCSGKTFFDLTAWINSQTNWTATGITPDIKISDIATIEPQSLKKPCKTPRAVEIKTCPGGVSYTTYTGNGDQLIDSRVPGSTQEDKARIVGGLKYDVYVAITVNDASKLNGQFNVTAIVEGRLVRAYTTPTAYVEQWTDDPAWCILDFERIDAGCAVPENELDIQSYLSSSAYYRQLVDDQPRFSLNLILDEQRTRQDWLTDMLFCCRSWPTYQRGKHGILADKPEAVSQAFTVQKTEELEFWWSKLDEEIERLSIQYVDPRYEWSRVPASADAATFRNPLQPREKTLEADGITDWKQASRLAWYYLNQAATCPGWVRYKTNRRAMNRSIGDVVSLTDPVLEFQAKKYRIMSMTEPQGLSIEMIMREYNPDIYTDELGSAEPIVNITTLPNRFEVPPDVTSLVVNEDTNILKDGTALTDINVSYAGDADSYVVSYQFDGIGDYIYAGTTSELNHKIKSLSNVKKIRVKVVALNRMGIPSGDVLSNVYTITGKSYPPPDVVNFSVGQSRDKLYFYFDKPNIPDYKKVEVREGLSWELSTYVFEEAESTLHELTAFTSGDKTYWIKAYDNSDNPSANAKRFDITVTDVPNRNIILGITSLIEQTLPGWYLDDDRYLDDALYLDSPSVLSGYYPISEVIDLGELTTVNIISWLNTSISSNTRITLEIRTSLDGTTWSDWKQYVPGTYTLWAVDQRVLIESLDGLSNVYCKSVSSNFDVDDKNEKAVREITVAGWTAFTFTQDFHSAPTTWVMAQTYGALAYIRNVTKDGFEAILIDRDAGAAVVGSFLYDATGF